MTTKKESRTIYVAEDGMKFSDERKCAEHELWLKRVADFEALRAKVDEIECIECDEAPFGSYYVDDDKYEYRWYRPKTVEEVYTLNMFFNNAFDKFKDVSEIIGEWICIEIYGGYEDYTGKEDVFPMNWLDEANESLVTFYEKLGYDVKITKQQSAIDIRDKAVERLWEQFEDVPMNPKTECIEQPFFQFAIGTHRNEIWRWFDKHYSKGVNALLMG